VVNRQTELFTTEITIPEMLDQIAVCKPYFAFEKMALTSDGRLAATLPPLEQPMDSECGVRAAAEIGRHLAILGSCAAARLNRKAGKHFYLAKKARLRATSIYQELIAHGNLEELKNSTLTSFAKAEFTGNRSVKAEVRLLGDDTGEELYQLEVDYAVLTPKMFERLFSNHRVDEYDINQHVYRDLLSFDELVEDLFVNEAIFSARFGFQPTSCAGHFPTFPALPVAVLMFILSKAAGTLLEEVTGKQAVPYVVVDADISAENLAFPDEKLYLVVQRVADELEHGQYKFSCRAIAERNDKHKFGDMTLILRVVEPAHSQLP